MSQDRHTSLTILAIERETVSQIDPSQVIDDFLFEKKRDE